METFYVLCICIHLFYVTGFQACFFPLKLMFSFSINFPLFFS